jgi:hypothetical protein
LNGRITQRVVRLSFFGEIFPGDIEDAVDRDARVPRIRV